MINGQWKYLYRAVDSTGQTSEFLLTAPREVAAALCFFRKTIRYNGEQQPVSDRDCLTLDSRLTWHILFPVAGDKGNTGRGAGTWSFRTEYRFADVFDIAGSPVDILLSEQPGGFWGRGYRDIDFGFITETGIATEVPVPVGGTTYRLRLGAGWLVNDTGTGTSVILGLN